MKVPFLSIFLAEETKALEREDGAKVMGQGNAELTYDPRSLDIQFNILCVASFLIKKKKEKRNGTNNQSARSFLTCLYPVGLLAGSSTRGLFLITRWSW